MVLSFWKAETVWQFLIKLGTPIPCDPEITLLPKRNKTYVHIKTCMWMCTATSFTNNYKTLERIQMFFIQSTDKQTVVQPYSRILFSNKMKKKTIDTCNNMNKSQMLFPSCKKDHIKRL